MPMRSCGWTGACFLVLMVALSTPAGAWAQNLSGQVNQDVTVQQEPATAGAINQDASWPGAVSKSITLTPGSGQFSADHLHFGRQVVLTLYNPNSYPMRFDTSQRIGRDYSWVVPANAQRTVAFRYWNPFSDEVKFLTYQDPGSLAVSQGRVTQPQTEAEVGLQPSVSSMEPAYGPTAKQDLIGPPAPNRLQPPPAQTHAQSAVRGYW